MRHLPGVRHTLHGHLRGPSYNTGVLGWDDDGWCDGVSRPPNIWKEVSCFRRAELETPVLPARVVQGDLTP